MSSMNPVQAGTLGISRRSFLHSAGALGAFSIVQPHVLGMGATSPNEKVNLAFIGVGWQGIYNLQTFMQDPDVHVVAVCDVFKEGPYLGRGVAGREAGRKTIDEYYGYTGEPGNAGHTG